MTTTPTTRRSRVDTLRHAAATLELMAKDLMQCSNRRTDWDNPQWVDDSAAKKEYDDLLQTARELREIINEVLATPVDEVVSNNKQ